METKEKIKRYVLGDSISDQGLDEKMALIYKDKDFLLKRGLWNDDIRKKVSTYNTLHNFTNMRSIQVKDNLLAYSTLYLSSKYSLKYCNQLDCDVLTLQDYFLSKGIEYVKLDTWDVIDFLQINRKPTKEFVKFLYQEGALTEANKKDPLYFSMLVDIEDVNSLIERYKDIKMDVDTKFKFINRIDYKEWSKFIDLFDDEFLIKYLGCFRYQELVFLRDRKRLHEILNQALYKERYKMYEKLETNQEIIEETRKELKFLVKSNLQKKIEIFKTLSNKGPNSVIEEIVNQSTVFNALIPLVSEIIKVMDPLVKDVFVFYILRFIKAHKSFVKGDHFSKWFINTCSLIKSIQKNIDIQPVLDFIRDLLKQKRYSCVLLLESVDLPEDILKNCKKIYRKVFIYEDYSLKLKMDVSDKYSILINRKFILKPSTANFKFMTLYEIESIKPESLNWVIKLIADIQNLEDDYFTIRNFAMIVRKFIDNLKEYHRKIKDFFEYFLDYEEEDIRVLCCSLISKIMSYEKKSGKASYDNTTLSEPKRMKFETVEKGEITTESEYTSLSEPKRRKIETTDRRENINNNYQQNNYHFNQQSYYSNQSKNYHYNQFSRKLPTVYNNKGEPILYLENFLREYLKNDRDSFLNLTRQSNLPVFDSERKRIVHLNEFLFGKNENNYYDKRRW